MEKIIETKKGLPIRVQRDRGEVAVDVRVPGITWIALPWLNEVEVFEVSLN